VKSGCVNVIGIRTECERKETISQLGTDSTAFARAMRCCDFFMR